MRYCRFCGSSKLTGASYETRTEQGVSFGLKHAGIHRGGEGTARFQTTFCETCREINVACSKPALRAFYSVEGRDLTVHIPRELAVLLATIRAQDADVRTLVRTVAERGSRSVRKFLKKGRNPCRWRHVGYPLRVRVCGQPIKVYLILGSEGTERKSISMRLAYGGGMAQCP